jgi:hypothetical protein
VHTYREGGSDQAGFVQVIQGHSPDMERLAALGRAREQTMAEQAPHILGMTVAEHADRPGDFTQTVYFTSQGGGAVVRAGAAGRVRPELR